VAGSCCEEVSEVVPGHGYALVVQSLRDATPVARRMLLANHPAFAEMIANASEIASAS
jgi:hypothetical protein